MEADFLQRPFRQNPCSHQGEKHTEDNQPKTPAFDPFIK
jgi:hypothetical protein